MFVDSSSVFGTEMKFHPDCKVINERINSSGYSKTGTVICDEIVGKSTDDAEIITEPLQFAVYLPSSVIYNTVSLELVQITLAGMRSPY